LYKLQYVFIIKFHIIRGDEDEGTRPSDRAVTHGVCKPFDESRQIPGLFQ